MQTWTQAAPSKISFGIGSTCAWSYETGKFETEKRRQADLYIFCLLAEQDREKVEPLNLDQWRFHVVPTQVLNEQRPTPF